MSEEKIIAYKGFKSDMTCRGYQFEIGKTFEHEGSVKACSTGFHSCENPMDVFGYYEPASSRYAEVEVSGKLSRHEDDSKIASATITIKAELTMPEFVQRAIDWVWSKVDKSLEQQIMTGDYSAASNTGNRSAASNTGYQSAAEVSGSHSLAAAFGEGSKARASESSAIVLCYRNDDGELIHIKSSKVGENGILPNVWYSLNENGEFVEAD